MYIYIYGIYVRLPCFVQSQVLEEAQRLQSLHGVTEPKRPFGLGSMHSLANSSGMMRKRILKVAEIAGFDDAQDVLAKLEPALPPSDRELKKESQLAIQDGQVEEPNQTMVVDSTTTDTGTARTTYSREKNDSALIADICQVVEYGLSLPPGSSRQKLVRLKYPNLMKSNVYSKWVARYFKYKLWLFPEELAKTTRAIPNWYINELKLDVPVKARKTVAGLPREVAFLVDKAQAEMTMGTTQATKRADPGQSGRHLLRSMKAAIGKYNDHAEEVGEQIKASNKIAWGKFQEATVPVNDEDVPTKQEVCQHLKTLMGSIQKPPKLYTSWKPSSHTVKSFNRFFGNRRCNVNTSGNYLSWDDPRMAHARLKIRNMVKDNDIHPGLLLKLDTYIYIYIIYYYIYVYIYILYLYI